MPDNSSPEDPVVELLNRVRNGDAEAEAQFIKLVYSELRMLAAAQLAKERRNHTLQPTALVHEAFLRLFRVGNGVDVKGREHFLALAVRVMRHVLVDHARAREADRRGGEYCRVEIDDAKLFAAGGSVEMIGLDQALDRLHKLSERASSVVELYIFGGLTLEEIAHVLEISARTVKRDWSMARTWLYRELYGDAVSLGSDV